MHGYKKILIGLLAGLYVSAVTASINHTPTQLVDIACPTEWKNIDVTIDPNSVSWANTTDRNAFLDYQDTYIVDVTKSWGSMNDAYADDALTVASECALRKNIVVDNYFSKPVDITTVLRERINIVPFIMGLLFD